MLRTTKFWFLIMPAALSAGILVGAYMAARMQPSDVEALFETVRINLTANSLSKSSFFHALLECGKAAALFFIFGTTVIGALPSVILLSIRGYAVGMSVGTLVRQFGVRGFFAAFGGIFPHSLFYIPCFVLMAVLSARFGLRFLRKETDGRVLPYCIAFLIITLFLLIGCFVEGYVSAPLLKQILYRAL